MNTLSEMAVSENIGLFNSITRMVVAITLAAVVFVMPGSISGGWLLLPLLAPLLFASALLSWDPFVALLTRKIPVNKKSEIEASENVAGQKTGSQSVPEGAREFDRAA